MSRAYDTYLERHLMGVKQAWLWISEHIPYILRDDVAYNGIEDHDKSKIQPDEYNAYDDHFYGGDTTPEGLAEFNRAWLMHIHRNPHHWQHWVLVNDDPIDGTIGLEMPHNNILEMICDWWSFSWSSPERDLHEIFSWYDEHKGRMILHDRTRVEVEYILGAIKDSLNADATANLIP